jgi:hypothetical protein
VIALRKPGKNPKFPRNLCLIYLLSMTGKLFEKVILKIIKNTLKQGTCLMKVSLAFVSVTARHCNLYEASGPCDPELQQ